MARRHGRWRSGKRLRVGGPHGNWKTTTFVAGLRSTGLVAPMVLDGSINAVAVQAYVKLALIPELSPRDMVVVDTLGFHPGPQVRAAIEAAGAGLPYSLTAAMRSAAATLEA